MDREEFSKYINGIYNGAMVNVALILVRKFGILDVFYDTDEPISLRHIAEKAALKERYTRELLSSLVAARIIHQDSETNLYSIPSSYKQDLKLMVEISPLLTVNLERTHLLQNCFRKDGPYGFTFDADDFFGHYHDFRTSFTDYQFETVIIPFLTENGMVPMLESGIQVLDIGCGTATFTNGFAKRFPKSTFTGLDMSPKALRVAKEEAKKQNITNVEFVEGDIHTLENFNAGQFDWVFENDTLHDLHDPHKALTEIYKVLKDDGSFSLFEFGFHSNPVDNVGDMRAARFYMYSLYTCLPTSMIHEPHIGYGACWGKENIEQALIGAKFIIKAKDLNDESHFAPSAFFHCRK